MLDRMFLLGGSSAAGPYWIGRLASSGTGVESGQGVGVDGSGNVYLAGYTNNGGASTGLQIAKYNGSGVLQWQRTLARTAGNQYFRAIAVDSAGNSHVCGYSDASGTIDFQLAKYNTSGTLQWQVRLGGTTEDQAFGIALDSSGNVYVCGYTVVSAVNYVLLAKYNSSGTIQWQRRIGASNRAGAGYGIAVDDSGNAYVCGGTVASGSLNELFLVKYNTSGTLQWQRALGSASDDVGRAVSVDSSGNVYIAGYSTVSALYRAQIAKYDSSGTLLWQRYLGSGADCYAYGIATDSAGNSYIVGRSAANYEILIAKYDTSGVLQWQRTLGNGSTSANDFAQGIAVDNNGSVYVCGESEVFDTSRDFLFAKLPADGSKTGTYSVSGVNIIYANSSLTEAASSHASSTTTLTNTNTALTSANTTLTDSATSLTSTVTTI